MHMHIIKKWEYI